MPNRPLLPLRKRKVNKMAAEQKESVFKYFVRQITSLPRTPGNIATLGRNTPEYALLTAILQVYVHHANHLANAAVVVYVDNVEGKLAVAAVVLCPEGHGANVVGRRACNTGHGHAAGGVGLLNAHVLILALVAVVADTGERRQLEGGEVLSPPAPGHVGLV